MKCPKKNGKDFKKHTKRFFANKLNIAPNYVRPILNHIK
jgi:hypothetical protein